MATARAVNATSATFTITRVYSKQLAWDYQLSLMWTAWQDDAAVAASHETPARKRRPPPASSAIYGSFDLIITNLTQLEGTTQQFVNIPLPRSIPDGWVFITAPVSPAYDVGVYAWPSPNSTAWANV
jgi:hypothetical protein